MSDNKLFIYGTLGPGGPNEHVMEAIGGTWTEAMVYGYLRGEGWGAQMGYPGLVLDAEGEEIIGFVFTSDNLAAHWDELDEFEGDAYERVITQARLSEGTIVDVQVFVLPH